MRRAIIAALVLSLFSATTALADPKDGWKQRQEKAHPRFSASDDRAFHNRRHESRGNSRYDRRGYDRHRSPRYDSYPRRVEGYERHPDRRYQDRHYRDRRGLDRHYRDRYHYDRNYRDRRYYDRYPYRHRYAPPAYRYPPGHRYGPWKRGDRLPRIYYAPHYVIRDYRAHRLYAPPRGCHWVRVNRDLLLVTLATGVVLDVLHHGHY